jgi:hypothetical protein
MNHFNNISNIYSNTTLRSSHAGRRLFLFGDSLTRQLMISLACLAQTPNEWGEYREAFKGTPHAEFSKASLFLKHGIEIHYINLPTGSLRKKYWSQLEHKYMLGKPQGLGNVMDDWEFDVFEVPRQEFLKDGRIQVFKELRRKTKGLPWLTDNDVIIFNPGIHGGNKATTYKGVASIKKLGHLLLGTTTGFAPRLIYAATPSQSFSEDKNKCSKFPGTWGKCQTNMCGRYINAWQGVSYSSRSESVPHLLALGERPFLNSRVIYATNHLVVGKDIDLMYLGPNDSTLGLLHLGYNSKGHKKLDCTHYCMPGVPDVRAAGLFEKAFLFPSRR